MDGSATPSLEQTQETLEPCPTQLSKAQLRGFYEALLFPRMIEEKMLKLLRQGRLSKWFSGIGQEAIAVGISLALREDDYILPMH